MNKSSKIVLGLSIVAVAAGIVSKIVSDNQKESKTTECSGSCKKEKVLTEQEFKEKLETFIDSLDIPGKKAKISEFIKSLTK